MFLLLQMHEKLHCVMHFQMLQKSDQMYFLNEIRLPLAIQIKKNISKLMYTILRGVENIQKNNALMTDI